MGVPDDELLVERADGIVTLTLNRPHRLNACTVAMFDGIAEVAREVRDNPGDRVLILTGAGDAFCSGVDLRALPRDGTDATRKAQVAAAELYSVSKPTITAMNGVAAGIGAAFALTADLVLAAESARLIMSFVKRALGPDGGISWLLPKLVGLRRAKELVFFGDPVTSAQALEFGLVNRVLPDAGLGAEVRRWAERLADGPAVALATAKAALNEAEGSSLIEAIEREYLAQKWNASTPDFAEAVAAFGEKREPVFRKP